MNRLAKTILALPSIKRLKLILNKTKVPAAEASATIIVEEVIRHKDKLKKFQRLVTMGQVFNEVIRCLRLRYYHYPIQYTLRIWYFRNLIIDIIPPLLIPRFQTEYFVTLMSEEIRGRFTKGSSLTMVDYCCGCGVIGLSLLKQLSQEYHISCTFVDINPRAIRYTRINAVKNDIDMDRVELIQGDLRDHLNLLSKCDVILSNPPYITAKQYRRLQHQVKLYEDPQALESGVQGLDLVSPLLQSYLKTIEKPLLGLQYGGQSLERWELQRNVKFDQYGRRRFLIV